MINLEHVLAGAAHHPAGELAQTSEYAHAVAHTTEHAAHTGQEGRSFESHLRDVDSGYEADDESHRTNAGGRRTTTSDLRPIYDELRAYHLTSANGKASIRQHGFNLGKKDGDSASAIGLNHQAVAEGQANHYISSVVPKHGSTAVDAADRDAALRLPKVVTDAHGIHDPKAVRVLVAKDELRTDGFFPPSGGYPQQAHMMDNKSPDRVLAPHGTPSAGNVREFAKLASDRLGHNVSLSDARKVLEELQSDSEDDTARLG